MSLTKSPGLTFGGAPAVNLLPPAERERRERRELTRRWARIAVAAVVAAVLVTIAMALYETSTRSALADEQARTPALLEELTHYQDVSSAVRDKSSYEAFRAAAMGTDLDWGRLFDVLRSAVPAGGAISGFTAVAGADEVAAAASAAAADTAAGATTGMPAPDGTAVKVELAVTSRSPAVSQQMVARLQKVPGVIGVDLGSLSSEELPSYTAACTVYLDASVFSGRYAEATP